jgi:glucose/arabinose dehydrogenase
MQNKLKLCVFGIYVALMASCGGNTEKTAGGEVSSDVMVDQSGLPLHTISLPAGFEISIWAEDVNNARSLTRGDKGTIFVSNRQGDKIYALVDLDGDHKADEKYVLAEGLFMPNGVAFRNGDLYVAEVNKIWRFKNIEDNLANPPAPELIFDALPSDRHHGWKYIAFGPDDKLYVPVGAPCNICESEPIYAAIHRINPDGSGFETVARGVRNTVGFDWHPETGELWFTDNGRDMLGDNTPPCELNRLDQVGQHFGYPYMHGRDISDPEFGNKKTGISYTAPAQELGPHVAPLGMKFYTGEMFPETYQNQIFIAEHGSWNRTKKIGYRVVLVKHDGKKGTSYEPFAEGWLDEGEQEAWGRPVDVLQLPDGSLLVSDDKANCIYRISYVGT